MIRGVLTPDSWLAKRMGKACFSLHLDPDGTPLEQLIGERRGNNFFVQTRVDVTDITSVHTLLAHSFTLVDTGITLVRQTKPSASNPSIRHARREDRESVADLAGRIFLWTRFHQDPVITKSIADKIQYDWVDNFFLGGRGDVMFVAENDSRIVGFHLAIKQQSDTMLIDSIGVAEQAQGRGFGRALVDMAQVHLGCDTLRVGTQLANRSAMTFYQTSGCIIQAAQYILHYHA